MTSTEPLLLLDVDGVLSPYLRVDASDVDASWPDWHDPTGSDVDLHVPLSRQMADRLAALPARPVWCTTWQHRANEEITAYFGWAPLPVLEPPVGDEWSRHNHVWKHLAAEAYVAAVQPPAVVWVDDEVTGTSPLAFSVSKSKDRLFGGVPRLLVRPNRYAGITRTEIDSIAAWLDRA